MGTGCSTPTKYEADGDDPKHQSATTAPALTTRRNSGACLPPLSVARPMTVTTHSGVSGCPHSPTTPAVFRSDVRNDTWPAAAQLVHCNSRGVKEVYEDVDGPILGSGSGGVVRTVRRLDTGDLFAMKTVRFDRMHRHEVDSLRKEVEIQRRLTHPNICRVFESFEERDKMYIVMEHCTGGSLVDRMKAHGNGYGERRTATLVEKMLSAVVYCHHNGVVHRDIKLDNFIFESHDPDAEIKLIDFGFAAEVSPGRETMWEQLGTPSYMAPELWADHDQPYDSSVDMWAIGVVTYMLLSGRRPFHHEERAKKKAMITSGPLVFGRRWEGISEEARAFCTALLHKNPRKRLSACKALDHAWIKQASQLREGDDAAHELARHSEIVDAVEDYCESSDSFKKLALEAMAFATPPAKLEELRTAFVKIDVDDSGTISLDEFKEAMCMRPEISERRVELMFSEMDLNHSGDIDYLEFLSASISTQPVGHDCAAATAAFSILDRDGDGLIGRDDIRSAVKGSFSNADVDKMLAEHGEDGLIDYAHFHSFIEQICSKALSHGGLVGVGDRVGGDDI